MKVGVIGTGAMGKNHARVYSTLSDVCRFVGVYDLNYGRASEIAEAYGGMAFHSLEDFLRQVDAVSIAVPTPAHYQIGLQCLHHNVHVLMEKPITETVEQAKDLIRKARERKAVLQVGHIELFNPTVQVLKGLLAHEEIIGMEFNRLRPQRIPIPMDVVSDAMIHDIYIAFYLLGKQVRRVYAAGMQYDRYTQHASALLKFPNGSFVQLNASYLTEKKVRTIRVITKKSVIEADLLNKSARWSSLQPPYESQAVDVPSGEPLRMQLLHFLEAIQRNQPPNVTGEDGLDALSLASQLIRKISLD